MAVKKISNTPKIYSVNLPEKTQEVWLRVYFKSGRIFEEDNFVGIGHLAEHYIAEKITQKHAERINTNAFIDSSNLEFHLWTTKKDFIKQAKILLEHIFKPKFDDSDLLEREKQVIANELKTKYTLPNRQESEYVFQERFVSKNQACWDIPTEIANLSKFNLADLERYHKTNFIKENLTICIGAYQLDTEVLAVIKQILEELPLSSGKENSYPEQTFSERKIVFKNSNEELDLTRLIITFPGLSYQNSLEDRITLNSICHFLTRNSVYGISQKQRDVGLYSIDYTTVMEDSFGFVGFSATAPAKRTFEIVELIISTLKNYKTTLLPQNFVRSHYLLMRNDISKSYQNNEGFFSIVCGDILRDDRSYTLPELLRSYRKFTPELIQSISQQIFSNEKVNLLFSGNVSNVNKSEIEKLIKKL